MAHANANLTVAELAAFDLDKPIVSSRNSAEDQTAIEWNEVGTVAAANRDEADYPPTNAVDIQLNVETKPSTAVASNVWYLILSLPAGVEYDWLGVFGHTLGNIGGVPLVEAQIADDAAFAVNLETIASWNPPAPTGSPLPPELRLTEFDLDLSSVPVGTAQRFTGLQFFRLKISNGGGANFVPEVGELVLGRRRQLKHQPNRPFGKDNTRSMFTDFTGGTGGKARHVDADRLAHLVGTINPSQVVTIADIVSLRDESLGLSRPIVWVQQPKTAPSKAVWAWAEIGEFQFDEIGPFDNIWNFELIEDGDVPLVLEL